MNDKGNNTPINLETATVRELRRRMIQLKSMNFEEYNISEIKAVYLEALAISKRLSGPLEGEPLYKVVIKNPEVGYYKEKLLTGEMLSQEYPGAYSLVVEEAAADLDAAVSVQNGNIKKTFTRIR